MKHRPLGDSGIEASVVGLGTWAIGGWMWGGTDEAAAIRAIHASIDAGANLIDTAPIYGFGVSEEIVGKALADRRDRAVLATKCGLVWHTAEGDHFFNSDDKHPRPDAADRSVYRCLGPKTIRHEIEQSLKRLRTDVIDLYQTHWQETATPIEDTMGELMKLKQEGKIRAIGVSNATPAQMDTYRVCGPIDSDQERYSMLDRKHEAANLPYCADNAVAFLAYSPIEQGLLTGKIGPERTFAEGDQRNGNPRFSAENRAKVAGLLDTIRPVADSHGIALSQLAVAWILSQRGCTHALVGARTPEQAVENAKAGGVTLTDQDLAVVDQALAGMEK
ncbi:aldo/keto reductase [Verrucomicrobiota bacterium]